MEQRNTGLASWSTRDILLTAMLGAVFGVLYQAWNYLYVPLETISPILGDAAMYGFWFIAGILVPYIIRRPGAALLGEFLAGLISMLLGAQWGLDALLSAALQGLACEAVFFLIGRWKNYHLSTLMVAGAAAALISFVHDYPLYGFAELAIGVQTALFVVRLISGAVLGGWLAKALGDALAGTGVLDNYPLGAERSR